MLEARTERLMIAHFDVDAFYASVAVREDPSLRGKPVAVAGRSRRAVVLTASYEARPYGVRSAMPLYRALEACPELIVVPPAYELYRTLSRAIFDVLGDGQRPVEALSLDEAFVDLGSADVREAEAIAQSARTRVRREIGLTISAGVSQAKMVAKIASDLCKPDGFALVEPGTEAAFLAALPAGRLWGIGPKTVRRLNARGIETIGQIAALEDGALHAIFGAWGTEVRELARGIDRRGVEPERETKSISTEETFEYDIGDEAQLIDVLRAQADELAQKLEREGLFAGTVGVKIKRSDFTTVGRQTHLEQPACDAGAIFEASSFCLKRAQLRGAPVRLLGTRCADFVTRIAEQQRLF